MFWNVLECVVFILLFIAYLKGHVRIGRTYVLFLSIISNIADHTEITIIYLRLSGRRTEDF